MIIMIKDMITIITIKMRIYSSYYNIIIIIILMITMMVSKIKMTLLTKSLWYLYYCPGAHYQERDSPILGLAISIVVKVSIFRFLFSAKQTKGVVSDQSRREIYYVTPGDRGSCQ